MATRNGNSTKEMSTSELAAELHTNPQALRRFLRVYLPKEQQPGSARGRYHLSGKQLSEVKKAWLLRHNK